MNNDEDTVLEPPVLRKLNLNSRLSAAKIFEDESNDSVKDKESESKNGGKMKSKKLSAKSSPYKSAPKKRNIDYETDKSVLERRQKQIDYGKNTAGYDNYRKLVPIAERTKDHPKTPVKYLKYSRRGWDGLIKTWRHQLHKYDPDGEKEDDKSETTDDEEIIDIDLGLEEYL